MNRPAQGIDLVALVNEWSGIDWKAAREREPLGSGHRPTPSGQFDAVLEQIRECITTADQMLAQGHTQSAREVLLLLKEAITDIAAGVE